jgi:hypothetical protein
VNGGVLGAAERRSMKWLPVAMFLLVAAVSLGVYTQKPQDVTGAITIKRLTCEPTSTSGTYKVTLHAENKTNTDLRNLRVRLTVARGELLADDTVEIGRAPREGYFTAMTVIPLGQDIEVCFAKFYTSSDQQLHAVYRP